MNEDDPVLVEEQAHLDELYKQLLGFRDDLTHQLEHDHKQAAADLVTMSEEIRPTLAERTRPWRPWPPSRP